MRYSRVWWGVWQSTDCRLKLVAVVQLQLIAVKQVCRSNVRNLEKLEVPGFFFFFVGCLFFLSFLQLMKKIFNAARPTKGIGVSFGPCATIGCSGTITYRGPGCSAIQGCWELLPGGQRVGYAPSIVAPRHRLDSVLEPLAGTCTLQ